MRQGHCYTCLAIGGVISVGSISIIIIIIISITIIIITSTTTYATATAPAADKKTTTINTEQQYIIGGRMWLLGCKAWWIATSLATK